MHTVHDHNGFSERLRATCLTELSIRSWLFQSSSSKHSALINGFRVKMQNDKTPHTNTVLWLVTFSCAICIQSWKRTGNQKSFIIANTFLKSCRAVCRNQGGGLVQAPQPQIPCILPYCPILLGIVWSFDFWPGPRAEIRVYFCFVRRGNGAVWSFVLVQVVLLSSWTNFDPLIQGLI